MKGPIPLKVPRLDEPWGGFLSDFDAQLSGPVDFHCVGGCVVSQFYGFARETADLDVLTLTPRTGHSEDD